MSRRGPARTGDKTRIPLADIDPAQKTGRCYCSDLSSESYFVEDSAEARPAVLPLTKIVCSNYAFGAASKQNCLRTAYVMSPTNDDIVEFARIGGISLIASFAASVYDRTTFAAFFACAGGYALARAFNLARRGR